ncbi:PglZ domain-containing protein [Salinigranum halophilum]|uniref:PglZ domain-containing protein n=1 Tax=Salinigranum halophilum TaxID=2565931 RepID=UPI00115E8D75|nr:PglZ domain-containing protein [Salinigranum halophilum]
MSIPPAHKWWADHENKFDDLGRVTIFLIDALPFDLAQRLVEQLGEELEVKQETRMATLPSETKFGMVALTPGRSFRFAVTMDDDRLTLLRGERSLSNNSRRVRLYKEGGWEVPDNPGEGWEHSRIVYYDKETDYVWEKLKSAMSNAISANTSRNYRRRSSTSWRTKTGTGSTSLLITGSSYFPRIRPVRDRSEI